MLNNFYLLFFQINVFQLIKYLKFVYPHRFLETTILSIISCSSYVIKKAVYQRLGSSTLIFTEMNIYSEILLLECMNLGGVNGGVNAFLGGGG